MPAEPPHSQAPVSASALLPSARLVRSPRPAGVWLLPLLAAGILAWFAWSSWVDQGHSITIMFREGYGLKPGDAIRHRGIDIGAVRDVGLASDHEHVLVTATLKPSARTLAREGAMFWVVRPEVALHRVRGLDTVIGARYIAMAPAPVESAPPTRRFTGADQPPVLETPHRGDRLIVLTAPRRGGLVPGSPVTYRQVPVGSVVAVNLSEDSTLVEISAVIEAPYASLVREGSQFWMAGGVDMNFGLKGFTARVDSLEAFVLGGIAFATPETPSPDAGNGHRFVLEEEVDEEWLSWTPIIDLTSGAETPSAP